MSSTIEFDETYMAMGDISIIVAQVPSEERFLAMQLGRELEFMSVTLDDLKKHVRDHGAVELFENGKQVMWRESPALKSYNMTVRRFADITKQLLALVPVRTKAVDDAAEGIREFCARGIG